MSTEEKEFASNDSTPLSQQVEVERSKPRQKSYSMDLRIHSPASLGYISIEGIDTAPALVRLAKVKGLDVIAVTDFYSGSFIDRVQAAAQESEITVIPGVVIRCSLASCDDVILTCLFPEHYKTLQVEEFLLALGIPREAFGNRDYRVSMSLAEILKLLDLHQGIAIPSRMDKTPHRASVIPQLVEKHGFRAFDLAYVDSTRLFKTRWPKLKFHLFSFSNAHALAQVGSRYAKVKLQEPGFKGISQLVSRGIV